MTVHTLDNLPICLNPAECWDTITRVIDYVSARFPVGVATDLQGPDTLDHISRRLHQYNPDRPFSAWLHRVVLNYGRDLARKEERRARIREALGRRIARKQQRPERTIEGHHLLPEAVRDRARTLRKHLDRNAWGPASEQQIDLYAVLLVHLRLEAVARIAPSVRDTSGLRLPPSALIAKLLPWRQEERQRRFKPGLPTLAELWDELAPEIDRRTGEITGDQLCAAIARLRPDGNVVNVIAWRQWCHRARERLAVPVRAVRWNGCLAASLV